MNKKAIKKWAKALREFAKQPSYLQLRFPMRLDTTKGDAYSPFGILCNIHAEDTGGVWEPPHGENGRLRNLIWYGGSSLMPPKEVADWLGVTESFLASLFAYNDAQDGFNKVADILEKEVA